CHYPNFCTKWLYTSSACGAGDRIKPGVERASAEPQEYVISAHQAREAGDSFSLFARSSSLRSGQWLPPASRACAIKSGRTWGSAALHPRLHSGARYRGLRCNTRALYKSLGNDKALKRRAKLTAPLRGGSRSGSLCIAWRLKLNNSCKVS